MSVSLILPIVLSAVALFVARFVSWMVVPLHKRDGTKLQAEDDFWRPLLMPKSCGSRDDYRRRAG